MSLSYTVKVNRIMNPGSKLVGFADLIINEVLEVKSFRIFDGANGLFVAPPAHKGKDAQGAEKWYDDVIFLEEREEGRKNGPLAEEIYAEMVRAFNESSGEQPRQNSRAATAQAQEARNQTPRTARKSSW